MQRIISGEEFRKLFEPDASVLANFTVGFVLTMEAPGIPDAVMGGTGTLVTIDDVHGILTAEHVIRRLKSHRSPVGLILAQQGKSQYHQLFFDPTSTKCTLFPNPNDSATGPDLGFMPLDHETLSRIRGKKSFHNLTKRRDRMLDDPPRSELGAWIISGMADEWTKDGDTDGRFTRNFKRMKEFRGMIGEVRLGASHTNGPFDYQVVRVQCGGPSGWPQNFGGFSGSAVWQVLVKEIDGQLRIADRLLSAVAFFQSDPSEEEGTTVRQLTCHGPKSIYCNLIDAVRIIHPTS